MKVTSEITQVSTRNYITGNGLEDMAFTLAWALWYAAMALMANRANRPYRPPAY